jgi:hypothetical protein
MEKSKASYTIGKELEPTSYNEQSLKKVRVGVGPVIILRSILKIEHGRVTDELTNKVVRFSDGGCKSYPVENESVIRAFAPPRALHEPVIYNNKKGNAVEYRQLEPRQPKAMRQHQHNNNTCASNQQNPSRWEERLIASKLQRRKPMSGLLSPTHLGQQGSERSNIFELTKTNLRILSLDQSAITTTRKNWFGPKLKRKREQGGDPKSQSHPPNDDHQRGTIIDQSGHARKPLSLQNDSNERSGSHPFLHLLAEEHQF